MKFLSSSKKLSFLVLVSSYCLCTFFFCRYCIGSRMGTNKDGKEWRCESCTIIDTSIPRPYKHPRPPPGKGEGKLKFISMAEICKRQMPENGGKCCKFPDCPAVSSVRAKRSKPSASKMDTSCKAIVKERPTGMS